MFYLLVFVINLNTAKPVVLKDCLQFKTIEATHAKDLADDLAKSGHECSRSHEAISWTCTDKKNLISKIVVMKDKAECKKFPGEVIYKLKQLIK